VITMKQLLSLDIIKAGQNVKGGVNPQDPRLWVKEEGGCGGAGSQEYSDEEFNQPSLLMCNLCSVGQVTEN